MAKAKTIYVCQQCGSQQARWAGRCPDCQEWNSLVEERVVPEPVREQPALAAGEAMPITEVESVDAPRVLTGIQEFDRILGGGAVLGSAVLIGGDPGIGKSTLLLQAADRVAAAGLKVLYVAAEESLLQTKIRAERLGIATPQLFLLSETSVEAILQQIERVRPQMVVVDSIQMVFMPELPSAPGSVGQVRESATRLVYHAKRHGHVLYLVGHVTKGGALAGPRTLEHMVDTVLYFEGDRHHAFRLLRAVKNRFGPTNEVGVFQMTREGLAEVANPSELFLSDRRRVVTGAAVVPCMEGTRALLVEVQALLATARYGSPERKVSGVDYARVCMLLAVLERRAGIQLTGQDVFVNVVGGVRVDEPAADLPIAVAIASSFQNFPVARDAVVIGEVGLGGEVRGVSQLEQRLRECAKLGFRHAYVPLHSGPAPDLPADLKLHPVGTLAETLDLLR
ncbi:MAG: DNA repair protein RadA [Candidatus Brocadiia bacterium]|jgi:DNA repair protein RadA/Sms